SQDTVVRLIERERGKHWVWRGKTGLAYPLTKAGADLDLKAAPGVGWIVGWVERPEGDVVYAMNLAARREQHPALRATLTRALLEANGAIPSSARP
ncbi:MAG: hypothetical protein ACREO3_02760, partial [Arenimonas sp.]